jgi:hypothetical protein
MTRTLREDPYVDEGGDSGEGLSNQPADDSGDDQSND